MKGIFTIKNFILLKILKKTDMRDFATRIKVLKDGSTVATNGYVYAKVTGIKYENIEAENGYELIGDSVKELDKEFTIDVGSIRDYKLHKNSKLFSLLSGKCFITNIGESKNGEDQTMTVRTLKDYNVYDERTMPVHFDDETYPSTEHVELSDEELSKHPSILVSKDSLEQVSFMIKSFLRNSSKPVRVHIVKRELRGVERDLLVVTADDGEQKIYALSTQMLGADDEKESTPENN